MKLVTVSKEVTESLKKRSAVMAEGYEADVVEALEKMAIGQGFDVTPDEGVSERATKRRLNNMAKEANKVLGWRVRNGNLFAYVEANAPVKVATPAAPASGKTS